MTDEPEATPNEALLAAARAEDLEAAKRLLGNGADPNAFTLYDSNDPASRLPALYFAVVGNHVELVRLLLERGADPNDGESIYHGAELDHRACLELLVAHGGDVSSRHSHWANTPLYFLAGYREHQAGAGPATRGMRWLLEHGADPNVTSTACEETPLHKVIACGRRPEVVEMLLSHGAAVNLPRGDGKTPYLLALHSGNSEAEELLRRFGADTAGATSLDRLLGAVMRGDETETRRWLAEQPALLAGLMQELPALAAELGKLDAIRVLAGLGFDLAVEHHWAGTALHHAAWIGDVALTRLLLELGAPVNVRDREFGSSPLGWAAHGSAHCRSADDDYKEVVKLLIEAGADRDTAVNRWGQRPEELATPRVAAVVVSVR